MFLFYVIFELRFKLARLFMSFEEKYSIRLRLTQVLSFDEALGTLLPVFFMGKILPV